MPTSFLGLDIHMYRFLSPNSPWTSCEAASFSFWKYSSASRWKDFKIKFLKNLMMSSYVAQMRIGDLSWLV